MIGSLIGAAIIGLALGLLGSGGSILTVPVLVYGLDMPEKTAIASSLAIVGGIALVGAVRAALRGRVVLRCIGAFGLPGLAGAAAGGVVAGYVSGTVQMVIFAVMLLLAAAVMRRPEHDVEAGPVCGPLRQIAAAGAGIGFVTGLVGVGGGFLLVPALLRFAHLELRAAIGTSLALIAVNCAVGLAGQWWSGAAQAIPPVTVAVFIAVGAAGLVLGQLGGQRLPRHVLRAAFTVLLAIIGVFTLAHTAIAG